MTAFLISVLYVVTIGSLANAGIIPDDMLSGRNLAAILFLGAGCLLFDLARFVREETRT